MITVQCEMTHGRFPVSFCSIMIPVKNVVGVGHHVGHEWQSPFDIIHVTIRVMPTCLGI
jgi:hypothetical protein